MRGRLSDKTTKLRCTGIEHLPAPEIAPFASHVGLVTAVSNDCAFDWRRLLMMRRLVPNCRVCFRFTDGRPLSSRDVKWTFDSLLQGKIRSTKAAVYRFVDRIDAPDDATVIFHMKVQDATAMESVGRRDGDCSGWQRGRNDAAPRRLRACSGSSALRPTGKWSSNATTIIGAERPNWRGCALLLCLTRLRRLSNCAKAAATSPSTPLHPTPYLRWRKIPTLKSSALAGTRLAYLGFNLRDPILKDARVKAGDCPENVSPAQWYATTTELLYDYNGPGDVSFGNAGAYLCFEDDYCSDVGSGVAFKIGSDSVEYTVASTGDGFTNDGPTLQNSGIVGTTVPEPSSVILLLTMLLAVAYVARKPIAQATRMKG